MSLDLQRAKLTSPIDVQAEAEVYTLLQIAVINRVPRHSDSDNRTTHLASNTAFSKFYRNVLLANLPVDPNLPEFY